MVSHHFLWFLIAHCGFYSLIVVSDHSLWFLIRDAGEALRRCRAAGKKPWEAEREYTATENTPLAMMHKHKQWAV